MAQWGRDIESIYNKEAIEALKEENVLQEGAYRFTIGNTSYVIFYMEGEDILPANKDRAINKLHKKVLKECIDHEIDLDWLYNLKNES